MLPSDLLTLPAGTLIRSGSRLATLLRSTNTRQGVTTRYAMEEWKIIELTSENCTQWVTLSDPR